MDLTQASSRLTRAFGTESKQTAAGTSSSIVQRDGVFESHISPLSFECNEFAACVSHSQSVCVWGDIQVPENSPCKWLNRQSPATTIYD